MILRYGIGFFIHKTYLLGVALLAGLTLFLSAPQATAQVTGISYTLSPIGSRVYWDDDAGLEDGYLYGGQLGLGFGQYVEVSGLYMLGNGFETDFSGFTGNDQAVLDALENLDAREVDVTRYGAKLRINVGAGSVTPFVTAGTGIIKFDPEGLDESENIYANGGAGLTFSVASRYTLSVGGEMLAYRFNPGTTLFTDEDLTEVGIGRRSFNQQTVYNPSISASLKFYLGGRSQDELTEVDRALLRQFEGGGFRLAVEPFYGQINFNEDLIGFPEHQALAGVNAGFDLGPYVGLRGFYWRATEQDKALDNFTTDFTDLTMYGGELNLRFKGSLGGGIAPYIALGGGYLDAGSDYEDFSGLRPEDRYFAIGGGGIELPLSSSLLLQAGVRGLFMSNQNVEDLSDPNSVHTSLMYTAGINFNLGGSGRTAGDVVGREMASARADAEARAVALEQELATIRARLDSLENVQAMQQPMPMTQRFVRDSTGLVIDTVMVHEARARTPQTITVPVPEDGEIYIRFGGESSIMNPPPQQQPVIQALPSDTVAVSQITAGQIRQIVQQALAEQQATTQQRGGMTADELEASLRAMEARLEQRIARENNRLRNQLDEQPREVRVVQEDGTPVAPDTSRQSRGLLNTFSQRQLVGAQPFIGLRLGEGTEQFLVGVRGDYRFPGNSYRFVPEVGLGFSDDGVALNAIGNVVYPFASDYLTQVQPYVGAGVGFVSDSGLSGLDLALNVLGGAEYTLPNGMTFFGEFSTLDFFDFNRVLLGYRLRF